MEVNKDFDIILIQEPSWSILQTISSLSNKESKIIVGVLNHSNWVTFTRTSSSKNNYLHVISYINVWLSSLYFSFCKDILNYRDICCCFFNNGIEFFLLNIYSDSNQLALKYFKDTEVDIWKVLIMTGDFNIRDRDRDSDYPFHFTYSNLLFNIADSFNLSFSHSIHQVPTRYADQEKNSNFVINLMFLWLNSLELNNHFILPEQQFPSDHAFFIIDIWIIEEFISDIIKCFKEINTIQLSNKKLLENIV